MAKASDLMDVWSNIKEVDLRPLRQQALNGVRLAIIGAPGSGRAALAGQMRRDPARQNVALDTPVLVLDLETAGQAASADLIILLVDSRKADATQEEALAQSWSNAGKKVLVLVNEFEGSSDLPPAENLQEQSVIVAWKGWRGRRMLRGSVLNTDFLLRKFAPAVIDLVPQQVLALGRYFPFFRVPVAHHLVNDTCLSNAAYSLSTGLAEIVPLFSIPLNVTDMLILTKTQAFLVYKLGLALGFSTRWQDYVAEFGSVLGGGFLWRQLARSLIGLIPVWGIVPKVAVSYAGTYVVGNVVLQWYLTGRHISAKQMRALYLQAAARGKEVARGLLSRIPRPRLPKLPRLPQRKAHALPAPKKGLPRGTKGQTCPHCGKVSAKDASFCQYCGKTLEQT